MWSPFPKHLTWRQKPNSGLVFGYRHSIQYIYLYKYISPSVSAFKRISKPCDSENPYLLIEKKNSMKSPINAKRCHTATSKFKLSMFQLLYV